MISINANRSNKSFQRTVRSQPIKGGSDGERQGKIISNASNQPLVGAARAVYAEHARCGNG